MYIKYLRIGYVFSKFFYCERANIAHIQSGDTSEEMPKAKGVFSKVGHKEESKYEISYFV